jgi:hypothetical protein
LRHDETRNRLPVLFLIGGRMRSTWRPEADALAYITSVVGDAHRARQEYLEAAQAGDLDVRAKPTLMAHVRELIPREDWFRAAWLELPDPLSTGLHFLGHGQRGWYDREVRWADIERRWPQPLATANPAERPQSRQRGPLPGATNRVHQERKALIPTLQAAQLPGEARVKTIRRLVDGGQLKLPGAGDRENMINELARIWGK